MKGVIYARYSSDNQRRRLINSFVNAIILYDDHLVFVGNYKDGSKTVTFAELEAAGLGSDLLFISDEKFR